MRIAAQLTLVSAIAAALCLPAGAQYRTGGTSVNGLPAYGGGGGFGGGSGFGNGSVQMYNPAYWNTPHYTPYGGYGPNYGYAPGYGVGYPIATPYAPIVVPGTSAFFRFGGVTTHYWKAPSGYYYPWGVGASYAAPAQVYYVNQGQTQAQNPPVYLMLGDMRKYLDDMKKDGRLTDGDYQHLFRRVQDLQAKYDHLMAMNGALDTTDEDSVRRDAGLLGSEIAQRVKAITKVNTDSNPASSPSPGSPAGSRAGVTTGDTKNKSGWIEDK
jgi:hypothetical protein